METYKCLECGNDLTDGVTLFTKSNVFNENMRYIYCSECGKVHLFNLSNGSIKNVDLSNEDIEKDVLSNLEEALKNVSLGSKEQQETHTCDCDETCSECNCIN